MDARTLTALEGSIEKWRKIAEEGGADQGASNCPLCQLFNDNDDCVDCPVAVKTGERLCAGSPYEAWAAWVEETPDAATHIPISGDCAARAIDKKSRALARDEYDFLRGLLPEGAKP